MPKVSVVSARKRNFITVVVARTAAVLLGGLAPWRQGRLHRASGDAQGEDTQGGEGQADGAAEEDEV
jgi:hypothetical protein